VPVGQGVIGVVAKKRRMMRMGNLQSQMRYQSAVRTQSQPAGTPDVNENTVTLPGLTDVNSQIAIPLMAQDRLVGVFAVESREAGAFDELDSVLLSIVANHVASAIDNARLHLQERDRARQLDDAVAELSRANETLEDNVRSRTAELSTALENVEHEKELHKGLLNRMAPPEVIPLMLEESLDARKITASVMFTDLENFTEFTTGMEPDEVFARLNHYLSWAGEIITRYRGYLNKTNGDGTMALFGVPDGNATHAIDAVLTGLNLQREVNKHIPLNLRIGINTGAITTGLLGPENRGLYDVLGESVNIASRMESVCARGGVTISTDTYEAVKPHFEFESLGEREIKGLQTVASYQVLGIKPVERDARRIHTESRIAKSTIGVMSEIIEFRDQHFSMIDFPSIQARDGALHHNEAVAGIALALLRSVRKADIEQDGLDVLEEDAVIRLALAHDVGKYAIATDRLNDPSPGTAGRDTLRADILSNTSAVLEKVGLTDMVPALQALYHFEATGGTGQAPGALIEIVALADIYDALTAPKLYKGAPWRISGALEEVMHLAAYRSGPSKVVSDFVDLMRPADTAISRGATGDIMIR
jgi:adenylate cyclase